VTISNDIETLNYNLIKGKKYFELYAQKLKQEILPGLFINAQGYNGSTPGPTIIANPGDTVVIRVHNELDMPTSVHWHGLDVPNVMDGVPEVEPSPKIEPGKYFDYSFKIINPPGTHMYHTHFMTQEQSMMGLGGGFIISDNNYKSSIDKDYFYMLGEFKVMGLDHGEVIPGIYDIDPMSDDFNFFTINGKCFPFTTPMEVKTNDHVRVRFANFMHDAHPMHIHGHQFNVTASDGNRIQQQNRILKNTINVASGETWDTVFIANNPGIWPYHCHIPHHMSNNMSEKAGGMFTTVVYK